MRPPTRVRLVVSRAPVQRNLLDAAMGIVQDRAARRQVAFTDFEALQLTPVIGEDTGVLTLMERDGSG